MEWGAKSTGFTRIDEDQRAIFHGTVEVGKDFSGRRLKQFSAAGSRFTGCSFERMRVDSAAFGGGRSMSEYVDCSFDGARIAMVPGGYARFVNCTFAGVQIKGWFCYSVELVDCTFSGRLSKAVFNGTVPAVDREDIGRSRNEFHGNDFSEMDLRDVAFRSGVDLTLQRLPAGPPYVYIDDAPEALALARARVVTWTDLELRRLALVLLNIMDEDAAAGQRQMLVRADVLPRKMRPAAEALYAELQP